ncbi:BlaI/MecI/CopY family transcriptional regulator [Planctomyces sp. SH-PL14]|uniref:BlaI/MecI/CopY family transcriptional regulator n=1 Tax=Planctomyces sp. SH-PL14 TaxID=1632864 RepID=UPI00078B8E66|nr:BlaI/MecI/CopY family transcriptional regulator [Planctomyces sp. SH-PL14]AMV19326.1 Penicillinase repressor [Planctomyces sp. SH-PL14]
MAIEPDKTALSETELEVLRILWQDAPLKPAEIQERFSSEIDNGTLRSVLVGLVEKGILGRSKVGKAFHYAPRVRRERLLARMTRKLAEIFTGGSAGALVVELIRDQPLDDDTLAVLRQIVADDPKRRETEIQPGAARPPSTSAEPNDQSEDNGPTLRRRRARRS